ncbi:MAG: phosphatase PAP2 family protein [Acidobacteria bacterium]|nr:phosphatase PAP2 family protein [Acidobacteriota bacterium]
MRQRRPEWLPHAVVILALILFNLLLFADPALDLKLALLCWEAGIQPTVFSRVLIDVSQTVSRTIPWLAGGMASFALGLFLLSCFHIRWRKYRIPALFFVLILALGPGLIVNALLKPHTGRPRPKQTRLLGGDYEYRRPFQMDEPNVGYSFPSGDSSVGFSLAGFYFIFHRRSLCLALLSLLGAVAMGAGIGLTRMVLGAHFASDIAWSAIFVFLVIFVLYYFVLNIPARDAATLDP